MPQLTSSGAAAKQNSEKIIETISENDKIKHENVMIWMKKDLGIVQQSLDHEQDDKIFVSKVLKLHKMKISRTQKYLMKYYRSRSKDGFVEIFQDRNAESDEILKSCQSVYLFSLPHSTKDGFKIIYMKLLPGIEPEDFDVKAFFKRFFMASDIRLKEDSNSKGDIFLLDLEGFSTQHALKLFNSGLVQKFVKCLKDTYPHRLESLYLMNMKPWHKRTLMLFLKMTSAGKKTTKKIVAQPGLGANIDGIDINMDSWTSSLQDFNDIWTQKLISYSSWLESEELRHRSMSPKKLDLFKEREERGKGEVHVSRHSEIQRFHSLEGVFRQLEL